jgi:hypothetical protein
MLYSSAAGRLYDIHNWWVSSEIDRVHIKIEQESSRARKFSVLNKKLIVYVFCINLTRG